MFNPIFFGILTYRHVLGPRVPAGQLRLAPRHRPPVFGRLQASQVCTAII
jgi:hypothetical protein